MSLRNGQTLLCQLEEHYQAYRSGQGDRGAAHKGFLRLFRRWISYNAQSIEPADRDFLEGVTRLVGELTAELADCPPEQEEDRRQLAGRAVDLMLGPKPRPEGSGNDRAWYLMVAEYASAPLFPYLSPQELRRQRDEMLARTPRRLMYPKQLELLESAEALLKD